MTLPTTQKIRDVSDIVTKGTTPTTVGRNYTSSGINFLKVETFTSDGIFIPGKQGHIDESTHQLLKRSQLAEGDILFSIAGALGRSTIVDKSWLPANTNQAFAIIRPSSRNQAINPRYLLWQLRSPAIAKRIAEINVQAAQANLSLEQVREFDLLSLPRAEQNVIAAALDDVDQLVAALERLVSKKEAIKQGMMQELLTGRTRLAGFTAPWTDIVLGDVSRFSKGSGLPKSALTTSGSTPCIHYGELFTSYGPEILHVKSRTNLADRTVVSEDLDVLMPTSDVTPRGLAKASSIHGRGVVLGGDILIIRPDAIRAYGPFLAHVIRRDADQVLKLVRGSTVYHLYASDMQNFTLAIPSVEEQRAIADALLAAECEIEALRLRLTKAREIKTGMMQELLTGRTRLPVEEVSS
jgi:type I restriction enzyme S subunit